LWQTATRLLLPTPSLNKHTFNNNITKKAKMPAFFVTCTSAFFEKVSNLERENQNSEPFK
jgi:hypothetical protein